MFSAASDWAADGPTASYRRVCLFFATLPSMRRRQFLTLSAASLGGVLVYSLEHKRSLLTAQDKRLRIPLRFFDESEALIVAAAASRIFPTDNSGPGAREAGVAIYIDRQLAGPYGRDRYRYTQGPFEDAPPEFGYQGKAAPREIYREGLKNLKGFDRLAIEEQDASLQQIESSRFFFLLRQHTIEGMFSDPIHGGNADMIGWQLVGFPGPRMSNYDDIDKHYGEAFRPKPVSLRQVAGADVHPSEEEK
jgi:gluconate 2-dehydrogenase gamma chain